MAEVLKEKRRDATATRHAEQLAELAPRQNNITCLWLGDSYPERVLWMPELAAVRERLAPHVAILAKGGDRVENLAWRLSEQTLDTSRFSFPRLQSVVLSIGLNNLADKDADKTPEKIMSIVRRLRARFPTLPIHVLALPSTPLGALSGWIVDEMNSRLHEECTGMPNVSYTFPWRGIDAGHFLDDNMHLTGAGYDILFENLAPLFHI